MDLSGVQPYLSRWKVDATLGTVNTDISAAASIGVPLLGAIRNGPTVAGRALLFNLTGSNGGFLYLEGSPDGVTFYGIGRMARVNSGGVPSTTEAYVWGAENPVGQTIFYRVTFVPSAASGSVVVTSQICVP